MPDLANKIKCTEKSLLGTDDQSASCSKASVSCIPTNRTFRLSLKIVFLKNPYLEKISSVPRTADYQITHILTLHNLSKNFMALVNSSFGTNLNLFRFLQL